MLCHRLRRWPNIIPTLRQVFSGSSYITQGHSKLAAGGFCHYLWVLDVRVNMLIELEYVITACYIILSYVTQMFPGISCVPVLYQQHQ